MGLQGASRGVCRGPLRGVAVGLLLGHRLLVGLAGVGVAGGLQLRHANSIAPVPIDLDLPGCVSPGLEQHATCLSVASLRREHQREASA